MNLPNTASTIHNTMMEPVYYFIIILTPVMALLPRFFVRTLKNTLRPSDDVMIQVEIKKEKKRGETLLTTFSATATTTSVASPRSPIFR
jgi:ABC-type Fe3+-siderophore transport system permease subunit